MRARNIKPGYYQNDQLADCSIAARYIFPGLWMLADCEGRLEDRPRRIKAELLPYDDIDVVPLLDELRAHGLIARYVVEGVRYIWVTGFKRNQSPCKKEKDAGSKLPAYDKSLDPDLVRSGTAPGHDRYGTGTVPVPYQNGTGMVPDSSGDGTGMVLGSNRDGTGMVPVPNRDGSGTVPVRLITDVRMNGCSEDLSLVQIGGRPETPEATGADAPERETGEDTASSTHASERRDEPPSWTTEEVPVDDAPVPGWSEQPIPDDGPDRPSSVTFPEHAALDDCPLCREGTQREATPSNAETDMPIPEPTMAQIQRETGKTIDYSSSASEAVNDPLEAQEKGIAKKAPRKPPLDLREKDWETWYAAYPKHVGKAQALKNWQTAVRNGVLPPLGDMLAALAWQKGLEQWQVQQYIPNPGTYLSRQQWSDEPPVQTVGSQARRPGRHPDGANGKRWQDMSPGERTMYNAMQALQQMEADGSYA